MAIPAASPAGMPKRYPSSHQEKVLLLSNCNQALQPRLQQAPYLTRSRRPLAPSPAWSRPTFSPLLSTRQGHTSTEPKREFLIIPNIFHYLRSRDEHTRQASGRAWHGGRVSSALVHGLGSRPSLAPGAAGRGSNGSGSNGSWIGKEELLALPLRSIPTGRNEAGQAFPGWEGKGAEELGLLKGSATGG